ncbi:MAG: Type IV fimbrial assembly, ATPase PilB [uncultured Cytophagales bacterium]|uniref:Type IV fimbrial assembly, ATPase PilB n=1 Tax=uncultured Cytophagales bacterium TaxID=158755 RepID=A0A6J4HW59_9SPHI|nr:MAG: Type IV fimbrial assembly, ATPase PilB [uncultured Cytophagales bacterium]
MIEQTNVALAVPVQIRQVLTADQAWHYRIIPKEVGKADWVFYVDAAANGRQTASELEVLFGKAILLEPQPTGTIQQALATYYRREGPDQRPRSVDAGGEDNFLLNLISEAKGIGSSDIHLEAYEERCRVRLRTDGMMVERYVLEKNVYPSLINKIKITANLDIAEKRLPQDGRIFFTGNGGQKFDIRVSILPTMHGEKVVLRLLSNDATHIDIHKLGFAREDLDHFLEGIKRPNGLVLISGPTGSGKTTTLYATLKLLNEPLRNILTIEDPIEYTLEGINQSSLKENIGFDFATALKTFLRQDPDVIMVGEVRDAATATMAVRAALTGHLVLSTIHTNSAWGTVSRLIDMGIPPFLLAGTLNTTAAQRLVRLLCPHCKARQPFRESQYPKQFKAYRPVAFHYVTKGCDACFFTGYKGRKAVYEVIPIDRELSGCIKGNVFDVAPLLRERNIRTLPENAFMLFESGETSLEEVYPLLVSF